MRMIRRDVLVGAVGALMAVALLGAGTTLVLRNDGIEFPDTSLQTVAGVELVDSLGTTVGPISAVTLKNVPAAPSVDYMVVAFRYNDEVIFMHATGGGLDIGGWIFYQFTGCQGDAAIQQNSGGYAVDHLNVLYGISGGFMDNWQSYSNGQSCTDSSGSNSLFVVSPLVDLDDLFTPPYHVE